MGFTPGCWSRGWQKIEQTEPRPVLLVRARSDNGRRRPVIAFVPVSRRPASRAGNTSKRRRSGARSAFDQSYIGGPRLQIPETGDVHTLARYLLHPFLPSRPCLFGAPAVSLVHHCSAPVPPLDEHGVPVSLDPVVVNTHADARYMLTQPDLGRSISGDLVARVPGEEARAGGHVAVVSAERQIDYEPGLMPGSRMGGLASHSERVMG